MAAWLWRWVEGRLHAHLPPAQCAATLGDLMEDYARKRTAAGSLAAAWWLIRECRDVSTVYRTGHYPSSHEHRGPRMPNLHLPETRLALRRIRRQPGAAIASIVTLATAFAAALATWVIIDSVLLSPVPAAAHADRLLVVQERRMNRDGTPGRLSGQLMYSRLAPLRASGAFTDVAAIGVFSALVGDPSRPISKSVAFVTPNFFDSLGIRLRGRGIRPEDDSAGAPLVTVLTHRYWNTELDGDPDVLGKTISIGGKSATIVGVAPQGFRGVNLTDTPALFVPVQTIHDVLGNIMDFLNTGVKGTSPVSFLTMIGRLPEGGTPQRSATALSAWPADPRRGRFELITLAEAALPDAARPNMERFTRLLASTVALLLLIGTLTVGLLVLIRSESRREELAMCVALGASKGRLVRGVLAESLCLSMGGLLLSIPLTIALLGAARTFELPGRVSVEFLAFSVDARIVALAIATGLGAAVVIGLIAGLVGVGGQVAGVLRARSGATPRLSRRRTRQGLIVAQVAVTMVLLVGTGLFARSVMAALQLNAAYAPSHVLTTSLNLRGFNYTPEQSARFFEQVRDELARHPAVERAALRASEGAMSPGGKVTFNGEPREMPSLLPYVSVDEHYFGTIGLPILRGRDFSRADTPDAELVGIVSESLGRLIANGGDPIGMTMTEGSRRLDQPKPFDVRIVGVVPDLVTDVNALEPLAIYYTMRQKPGSGSRTLHLRSRQDHGVLAAEVRQLVERIDGRIAPSAPVTLADQIARQMAPQQFGAAVLGSLATVALILTLLGTFVIAETMAKAREREMGVRAALGASARHLGGLVVTETAVLVGLGIVGGLGLTWLAASTVEALLYQTEPFDLMSLSTAVAGVLVLALLVSVRPALRAARVDVAALLRE
jgi:putative ABC transport system permease protein